MFAYVGSWEYPPGPGHDRRHPGGLHVCTYDVESGALQLVGSVAREVNVGQIAIDDRRNVLYCAHEHRTHGKHLRGGGLVYAFAIDAESGNLSEINHRSSFGVLPCYLSTDRDSRHLLVVHHTERTPIMTTTGDAETGFRIANIFDQATVVLLPLADDGSIGDPLDIFVASGPGGPLPRQTNPQLHSVVMSPDGKHFAICDKGSDRVFMVRIDETHRRIRLCSEVATIPGGSPRYCVFHQRQPFLFVNFETKPVVSSFRYFEDGSLEPMTSVEIAPPELCQGMSQSDIVIHPSGEFLYSLIRGENAVSVFAVDAATGRLERVQTFREVGEQPRGFATSPDGRFMLVAQQIGNEVRTLAVRPDGVLSATDHRLSLPSPGTIRWGPVRRSDGEQRRP